MRGSRVRIREIATGIGLVVGVAGCRLLLGIGEVDDSPSAPDGDGGGDANGSIDGGGVDGDVDGSVVTPTCSNGWCWANPLPQGLTFTSVWANGTKNAWAVGERGLALEYDGTKTLKSFPIGQGSTEVQPKTVWASSSNDVWALIDLQSLAHYNGTKWSGVMLGADAGTGPPAGAVMDLWGSGPTDVWAVGMIGNPPPPSPAAYHGAAGAGPFVNTPPPFNSPGDGPAELQQVAGTGPMDVWAVTYQKFFHWTGSSWSGASCESTLGELAACQGPIRLVSVAGDLWAISSGINTIGFYQWKPTTGGGPNAWLRSGTRKPWTGGNIVGTAATKNGDVWVLVQDQAASLFRFRDDKLESIASVTGQYAGLSPIGDNELLAVGQNGRMAIFDGTSFKPLPGSGGIYANLQDIAVIGNGAGETAIAVGMSQSGSGSIVARRVAGGSELFAEFPVGNGGGTQSCWMASATDAWLVAADIFHTESPGGEWKRSLAVPATTSLRQIRGRKANDVWVVGTTQQDGGLQVAYTAKYDGMKWTDITTPETKELYALWLDPSNDDVWAVGNGGVVLQRTNNTWSQKPAPPSGQAILSVSGSSASDVWIATTDSIFRWDGAQWTPNTPPARAGGQPSQWTSVAVRAKDNVWAASQNGRVGHWDGQKWSVDEGFPTLSTIVIGGDGSPWVSGSNGALLHHAP